MDIFFIYDGKICGEYLKFKILFIINKYILMLNLFFIFIVIEKNNNLNKMYLKFRDIKWL